MLKDSKKLLVVFLLISALASLALPVLAQDFNTLGSGDLNEQNQAFFKSSGLSGEVSISEVISDIIKLLLSFLGVIFIILIIYAGFKWMLSRGNEEDIGKAKRTMTAAVIGLAIVLSAYLITYFVIDQLLEATKGGVGLD